MYYSASQFLTSDVAALKNAYAELAEQARGYALRVSFEQLLFADVRADYHTLFVYKSCVEEIIKEGNRKLALHFRAEVVDYEQVAIIIFRSIWGSNIVAGEFFFFKIGENVLRAFVDNLISLFYDFLCNRG